MAEIKPPLIVREEDGSLWLNVTEEQADALRSQVTILPDLLRVNVGSLQIETRDGVRPGYLAGRNLRVTVDAIVMPVTAIDLHADMKSAVTATMKFLPQVREPAPSDDPFKPVTLTLNKLSRDIAAMHDDCPPPIIADVP